MNTFFRKFFIINVIVSFILALAGTVLFVTLLSAYYHPFFSVLLPITLTINLVLFYVATRKVIADTQLINLVVKSFAIKFFSYLGIALVFFLSEKATSIRIAFVISLFILYVAFTWLEIVSLLKFLNSGKK